MLPCADIVEIFNETINVIRAFADSNMNILSGIVWFSFGDIDQSGEGTMSAQYVEQKVTPAIL